jgi:hypothetical protein
LLEVRDSLHPLLKLSVLRLDGILEMHDCVGIGVHLLTCEVKLLTGEVPPVLGLTKVAVCDLQLQIHLHRLTCPMMEDGILSPKPLHRVQCECSLLDVRVQMHTQLDDDPTGVVLQVEQVPRILGQKSGTSTEVWAGEVTHGLVALVPLRFILILNWEECNQCVGGGGEAALKQESESHVCHLLDGVIHLIANDGSPPCCRGVKGYIHLDLTHLQAVGMKGTAAVDRDQPVVVESNVSAQELSWDPRMVSACGPEESILVEGTVGVVIDVHLKTDMKTSLT